MQQAAHVIIVVDRQELGRFVDACRGIAPALDERDRRRLRRPAPVDVRVARSVARKCRVGQRRLQLVARTLDLLDQPGDSGAHVIPRYCSVRRRVCGDTVGSGPAMLVARPLAAGQLALEALDTTTAVDELLLAGVEGVALVADLNPDRVL